VKLAAKEVDERLHRMEAACRQEGVKLTPQRLEIFREIAASCAHPDAETVFQNVKKRVPSVSLDTVYRTLWLLDDLGVVFSLSPRRGTARFDANLQAHHHFVCAKCGAAFDFESPSLEGLRPPPEAKAFGRVIDLQVEVRGLCRGCEGAREGYFGSKKTSAAKR
jgi:Fur family peroxide stress response transcriptional regulator